MANYFKLLPEIIEIYFFISSITKQLFIQAMGLEFGSAGAVCSIEESSGPQNMRFSIVNLRVQKVMSQRSKGLCTCANTFPAIFSWSAIVVNGRNFCCTDIPTDFRAKATCFLL